jgi:hypothetical protein
VDELLVLTELRRDREAKESRMGEGRTFPLANGAKRKRTGLGKQLVPTATRGSWGMTMEELGKRANRRPHAFIF